MAIIEMHALMYSNKPEETRKFFSDILGFSSVDAGRGETRKFFSDILGFSSVDAGRGWMILAMPPAELAVHPAEGETEHHELYLMCDDIVAAIDDLGRQGVETTPIRDRPWGRLTQIVLPSGQHLGMYEPKHPLAITPLK